MIISHSVKEREFSSWRNTFLWHYRPPTGLNWNAPSRTSRKAHENGFRQGAH